MRDPTGPSPWPERQGWVREQLTEEQLARFAGISDRQVVDVDGLGEVLFCHGSPRSDEEIVTRATPAERLSEILSGVEQTDVEPRRTPFDLERAAHAVRATAFPDAEEFAEEHVLHPASAEEATEHFEQMAG